MIRSYLPIVIFAGVALLFLAGSFFASTLLAPSRRTMAKTAPYECGIIPENDTQQRFGVKFYLLAIAFIVLDVEIVFLYPFSTIFVKRVVNGTELAGLGPAGLVVMGIFLLILLVPFAYLLSSGALNFGPSTPKVSSLFAPIIRSQGFVASSNDVAAERAFAASDETSGSERPEGRETASEDENIVAASKQPSESSDS